MNICIFNSLAQHHEMFAHVLDYFKGKNKKIDVYTNITNNYGWLRFYEIQYGIYQWYPILFFNPDAYDYVFLLTDDDHGYEPFWKNTKVRVIVIEHYSPRELNNRAYLKLQTRKFVNRSPPSHDDTWILPVWDNPRYEKYDKLTVLSIGNATNGLDLPSLFKNYKDIQFILCDRDLDTYSDSPNISKYNKLDTSKLIEFAGKSHYILFWPTTEYSLNHKWNSMSGCFPLAYSVGTPILLPQSFIEPLGLSGLVGIPDGSSICLDKPDHTLYETFNIQRLELLKRRNHIFDSFLYGIQGEISTTYTAVIVEPRKHPAMEFVLNNFLENLSKSWNFIIFHGTDNKEWLEDILNRQFVSEKSRISLVNLNVANITWHEYNRFISSAEFLEKIPTEHFLIFQTDTMICSKEKDLIYTFMKYDYVGAPWPESGLKESFEVGNGGLSLRKKSKMLQIIKNIPYPFQCPEDLYYCGVNHNIPIYKPTWSEAKLFSIESIYSPRTFGIHKAWAHIDPSMLENQFPGIYELMRLNS